MEAGLAALKAASAEITAGQDDVVTPVIEHRGTIVTMEDGKMVVSGIPPSATLLSAAVENEREYFSDSEVPRGSNSGRRRWQSATVGTQTTITASDVDYICNERCATPPGEWYGNLSECSNALERSPEAQVTAANRSPIDMSNSSNFTVSREAKLDWSSGSAEQNVPTPVTVEDFQFDMEMSDDETCQTIQTMSLVTESNMFGRCASMPSINRQTDAWAASQYMSTAMNDYTPTTRYCIFVPSCLNLTVNIGYGLMS